MDEKKIKKWWLTILLAHIFFPLPVSSFLNVLFPINFELLNQLTNITQFIELKQQIELEPLTGLFVLLISIPIMYYCAYKNPGTILLSLTIFFGFVCLIFIICFFINALFVLNRTITFLAPTSTEEIIALNNLFYWLGIAGLYSLMYHSTWFYLCYKLRIVNKKIQSKNLLNYPLYCKIFETLQTTNQMVKLESLYREAKTKHPEISWHLKKKYKERKDQLKLLSENQ